jgi:hypothetical protein
MASSPSAKMSQFQAARPLVLAGADFVSSLRSGGASPQSGRDKVAVHEDQRNHRSATSSPRPSNSNHDPYRFRTTVHDDLHRLAHSTHNHDHEDIQFIGISPTDTSMSPSQYPHYSSPSNEQQLYPQEQQQQHQQQAQQPPQQQRQRLPHNDYSMHIGNARAFTSVHGSNQYTKSPHEDDLKALDELIKRNEWELEQLERLGPMVPAAQHNAMDTESKPGFVSTSPGVNPQSSLEDLAELLSASPSPDQALSTLHQQRQQLHEIARGTPESDPHNHDDHAEQQDLQQQQHSRALGLSPSPFNSPLLSAFSSPPYDDRVLSEAGSSNSQTFEYSSPMQPLNRKQIPEPSRLQQEPEPVPRLNQSGHSGSPGPSVISKSKVRRRNSGSRSGSRYTSPSDSVALRRRVGRQMSQNASSSSPPKGRSFTVARKDTAQSPNLSSPDHRNFTAETVSSKNRRLATTQQAEASKSPAGQARSPHLRQQSPSSIHGHAQNSKSKAHVSIEAPAATLAAIPAAPAPAAPAPAAPAPAAPAPAPAPAPALAPAHSADTIVPSPAVARPLSQPISQPLSPEYTQAVHPGDSKTQQLQHQMQAPGVMPLPPQPQPQPYLHSHQQSLPQPDQSDQHVFPHQSQQQMPWRSSNTEIVQDVTQMFATLSDWSAIQAVMPEQVTRGNVSEKATMKLYTERLQSNLTLQARVLNQTMHNIALHTKQGMQQHASADDTTVGCGVDVFVSHAWLHMQQPATRRSSSSSSSLDSHPSSGEPVLYSSLGSDSSVRSTTSSIADNIQCIATESINVDEAHAPSHESIQQVAHFVWDSLVPQMEQNWYATANNGSTQLYSIMATPLSWHAAQSLGEDPVTTDIAYDMGVVVQWMHNKPRPSTELSPLSASHQSLLTTVRMHVLDSAVHHMGRCVMDIRHSFTASMHQMHAWRTLVKVRKRVASCECRQLRSEHKTWADAYRNMHLKQQQTGRQLELERLRLQLHEQQHQRDIADWKVERSHLNDQLKQLQDVHSALQRQKQVHHAFERTFAIREHIQSRSNSVAALFARWKHHTISGKSRKIETSATNSAVLDTSAAAIESKLEDDHSVPCSIVIEHVLSGADQETIPCAAVRSLPVTPMHRDRGSRSRSHLSTVAPQSDTEEQPSSGNLAALRARHTRAKSMPPIKLSPLSSMKIRPLTQRVAARVLFTSIVGISRRRAQRALDRWRSAVSIMKLQSKSKAQADAHTRESNSAQQSLNQQRQQLEEWQQQLERRAAKLREQHMRIANIRAGVRPVSLSAPPLHTDVDSHGSEAQAKNIESMLTVSQFHPTEVVASLNPKAELNQHSESSRGTDLHRIPLQPNSVRNRVQMPIQSQTAGGSIFADMSLSPGASESTSTMTTTTTSSATASNPAELQSTPLYASANGGISNESASDSTLYSTYSEQTELERLAYANEFDPAHTRNASLPMERPSHSSPHQRASSQPTLMAQSTSAVSVALSDDFKTGSPTSAQSRAMTDTELEQLATDVFDQYAIPTSISSSTSDTDLCITHDETEAALRYLGSKAHASRDNVHAAIMLMHGNTEMEAMLNQSIVPFCDFIVLASRLLSILYN